MRFVESAWAVFLESPRKIFIAKLICEVVIAHASSIPPNKDLALILFATSSLYEVDKECGSIAFAAMSSMCKSSTLMCRHLAELKLLDVALAAAEEYKCQVIELYFIYSIVFSVYLSRDVKSIQDLILKGAVNLRQQVIALSADEMRQIWTPVLVQLVALSGFNMKH
jgi:hypothetical protein